MCGPKSQSVNHYWSVSWKDYLVTNYDIVYAAIDGRGTGYQVTSFCFIRPSEVNFTNALRATIVHTYLKNVIRN